jgi:hypothetical protein
VRKVVVSTKLEKAGWNNSTVITGDVAQEVGPDGVVILTYEQ